MATSSSRSRSPKYRRMTSSVKPPRTRVKSPVTTSKVSLTELIKEFAGLRKDDKKSDLSKPTQMSKENFLRIPLFVVLNEEKLSKKDKMILEQFIADGNKPGASAVAKKDARLAELKLGIIDIEKENLYDEEYDRDVKPTLPDTVHDTKTRKQALERHMMQKMYNPDEKVAQRARDVGRREYNRSSRFKRSRKRSKKQSTK